MSQHLVGWLAAAAGSKREVPPGVWQLRVSARAARLDLLAALNHS